MDASVDRIAQPWGSRTPYGRHGKWPTRVDTFLKEGVEPEAVRRWVQTASLLHSDGDAMDIAVADGRMVGVRGRARDRVNRGRLGPKDQRPARARPATPGSGRRSQHAPGHHPQNHPSGDERGEGAG